MKTGVKSGQCQGSSSSMSSNDTCSITTVLLHSPAAVSDVCSMCCLSVTEGSLDRICCVTSTSDLLLFLLKYQRSITNTTKQVYFLHKKRMFFFFSIFHLPDFIYSVFKPNSDTDYSSQLFRPTEFWEIILIQYTKANNTEMLC